MEHLQHTELHKTYLNAFLLQEQPGASYLGCYLNMMLAKLPPPCKSSASSSAATCAKLLYALSLAVSIICK